MARYVRHGDDPARCALDGCMNEAVGIQVEWSGREGDWELHHGAVCGDHYQKDIAIWHPEDGSGGGSFFQSYDAS